MLESWELAVVPRALSSHPQSEFHFLFLLFLWYFFSFTGPYNSVRDVSHFRCAHRHTTSPFFHLFSSDCICPIPTFSTETASAKIFHGQSTKYWGTQVQPFIFLSCSNSFFFEEGWLHLHTCMWPKTYTSLEFLLNAASEQGTRLISEKDLCHTLGLSLLVSVLNHLFYRISPSSVSPLLFCPPFTGPNPAVQELFLLPFAHLEQNTHLQSKTAIHRSTNPNRESQPSFWMRFASN